MSSNRISCYKVSTTLGVRPGGGGPRDARRPRPNEGTILANVDGDVSVIRNDVWGTTSSFIYSRRNGWRIGKISGAATSHDILYSKRCNCNALKAKGISRAAPPSAALLPIHQESKLPSLGEPMTFEFERRSASLATAIYSQN